MSRLHAQHRRGHGPIIVLGLAALLLAACSLAGDVTPPPGAGDVLASPQPGSGLPTAAAGQPTAAASPTPAGAASPLYPAALPAALEGGGLFLEHCASCHGERGAGGGTLAAQLPKPVPDFSNPATLRERTPQALFSTITTGRLDALMPPFADTLSDAQRWDLVALLYTLSTAPEQLAAGQAVYTANCAACHGATGQGDGAQAAGRTDLPSFTNQEFMSRRSQQDFFKVVSGGDAGHPFTNLSEADRWAALDAVRAFAYSYSPLDALTAEREGTVDGRVVNKTPGGGVPGGLPVSLYGFEGQNLLTTLTTTLGADGTFHFDNVPFKAGRQFQAATLYQEVPYGSEVGSFDLAQGALALDVPIYDLTDDPAALSADQVHIFLQFDGAGAVTVGELMVFSNSGDHAYYATNDRPLNITLPAAATGLAVQNATEGQEFVRTDTGMALIWSVAPGESTSQVLFSYKLAYDRGTRLEQTVGFPVGNVDVLVSDLGVKVSGAGLQALGQQTIQGQPFQNLTHGPLAAGESLAIKVSGATGRAPGAADNALGLAVGGGALLAAALGIGFWLLRRPAPRAAPAANPEALVQVLAELDDAYAAGEVAAEDYPVQRAALKAALRKVWRA